MDEGRSAGRFKELEAAAFGSQRESGCGEEEHHSLHPCTVVVAFAAFAALASLRRGGNRSVARKRVIVD